MDHRNSGIYRVAPLRYTLRLTISISFSPVMTKVKPITSTMVFEAFWECPELALVRNFISRLWMRIYALLQMAANLNQTLMYLWLLSHATCLLGFVGSFFVPGAYDAALVGCTATYVLAVNRHLRFLLSDTSFRGSLSTRAPISELLRGENTILLAMATLMATTAPSVVKMVPFATFASMNLVSFVLLEVMTASHLTKTLVPFLRYVETTILSHMCYWDYAVMAAYAWEGKACWLVIYVVTWLMKLEISELSRKSVHGVLAVVSSVTRASGIVLLVLAMEDLKLGAAVLLPTREILLADTAAATPVMNLSLKHRVESLMFDSFSIINDVDR